MHHSLIRFPADLVDWNGGVVLKIAALKKFVCGGRLTCECFTNPIFAAIAAKELKKKIENGGTAVCFVTIAPRSWTNFRVEF
jgi:hypothetical protein